MALFRRVLRLLFGIFGFLLGVATAASLFVVRNMVAPPRQRLWASPGDVGLDYEEVQFPAQDGTRVSGWFIPAAAETQRDGATIVLLHGWTWNRLGYAAEGLFANLLGGSPVEFLRLIHALHREGYQVLTIDLRNHGQSAASPPVTFGQGEAKDVLGALAYLHGRSDVNQARIGAIGFSMGANALLYALPQTDAVRAAVVVQPTSPGVFAGRMSHELLGPLGTVVLNVAQLIYQLFGGPRLSGVLPSFAASGAGDVPVLYVQGKGDQLGSVDDVARMAEMTPNAEGPLFVDSSERFSGYQYLLNNPKVLAAFFAQHLG